jgi:K+-sensing histidine kinase KdpD
MQVIIKRAKETFGHDVIAFLPDPEKKNTLKPFTSAPDIDVDENERAAAFWSYEHQKVVGSGTDTLPNSKARFIPLVTARGKVGVLAILVNDAKDKLTIGQENVCWRLMLISPLSPSKASCLNEEAHNAQILRDTEKLQTRFTEFRFA